MYLWLEIFLLATGITARLIIPASTCGSGVNLLVVIFIWLAFLIHLLEKSRLSAEASTLSSSLKLLLFLFVALIIASFINAPYKFGAGQYLVAWLSDIVLFYLVYSLCVRDAKYITTLLSVFLATALVIVLYALYQHFWELRGLAVQIQQNPHLLDIIPVDLRGATLARAKAGEPFATFTYQNSFGAFLILVVPLFMAMLSLGRRIILIIVGLMAIVLLATGSKGAIISSVIPLMVMIYYLPSRFSKQERMFSVIVILVLFILTGIFGYSQMSDSVNVRLGYWDATVKIIRDNPLSGVGLNQFSNSYLYYKSADAGEVLKAHNDYLQIASELGIPALLVFLAIWFIILKSIFRSAREPSSNSALSTPHSFNLSYILGAGFAFLISEVFQSPLFDIGIPFLSSVIVFMLWLVAFRFLSGYLATILDTKILRLGLFAGLVAFLIHCLVDFNFYVQGLSMSVWFVGAIFFSTTESFNVIPAIPMAVKKIINGLAIILIICIIGVFLTLAVRFIRYDPTAFLSDNNQGKGPIVIAYSPSYWNPYAVEPKLTLAWWHHKHSDFSGKSVEPLCLKEIGKAISLNPLAPMLYNQMGRLCLEHAEQERQAGHEKMARIYEQRAKRSFQMVRELYPTWKQQD